jgi:hypothetical protein
MRRLGLACVVGALGACSSPAPTAERAERAAQAIIKGTASDASQDAVVLIAHIDSTQPFALGECTATLIAANLVLTARHCIAQTADAGFVCTEDGVGSSGGNITRDYPANSIYVFTGASPRPTPSTRSAKGRGKQILSDGGKNLCNHDFALVVLEAPVEGALIAPIRLETPPVKGATFTAVGWGLLQNSTLPTSRQQRAGIKIANVGPFADPGSLIAVPDKEFQVGEGICQGDSGGPALDSESGAVIGVVSRGGNGSSGGPPASGCIGTETQNYYSHTTAYKDLILQAFEAAGAEPWIEGQPDPRLAKFGETCDGDAACRSNICLTDKKTCSQTCDDAANKCPDGYVCTARGGAKVCAVKPPAPAATQTTTSGCAVGERGAAGACGWAGGFALAAATLARRRLRRSWNAARPGGRTRCAPPPLDPSSQ